jgi:hypothetical protein
MKLNSNGKLARFYQWSYDAALPQNFCEYFWALAFAALFFPLTWMSYPWDSCMFSERVWKGFCVLATLALIAYGLAQWVEHPFEGTMIVLGCIGGTIGLVAIIIGGTFLLESLQDWESESKPTLFGEIVEVLREKKDAVKENYCPKIDWK